MKRMLPILAALVLATGCVYDVRVGPPEIALRRAPTPSAAVFAVARFEDAHPEKPNIGFTIQHCIMRYLIVFGPIVHRPVMTVDQLVPQTLAACMKEQGHNVTLVDDALPFDGPVCAPEGADYVVTGRIHEFHFTTPSADFAPARIRVAWTAVVRDARGREVLRRRMEYTDKKLLGFGTNAFYNVEPFVRKALYSSVDEFAHTPELKNLLWRGGGTTP